MTDFLKIQNLRFYKDQIKIQLLKRTGDSIMAETARHRFSAILKFEQHSTWIHCRLIRYVRCVLLTSYLSTEVKLRHCIGLG